jgi:hydroxyacylglutathione hydrolase
MDWASNTLNIRGFELGPFGTNCYVLWHEGDRSAWVIDASFEPEPMLAFIRQRGLNVQAVILTHAHVDHIAGVSQVLLAFPDAKLMIHEQEERWLTDAELNLSAAFGSPVTTRAADRLLRHGDQLDLGAGAIKATLAVRHTPGHSPGGITLVAPGIAIVGDALFAGSIGRTDFPGCDHDVLLASIRREIYSLPGETKVYPGHGPETTVGHEKLSNPYVRG